MDAPRLLIVEDEPVTRMMLEARLRSAGYSVQSAPSAEAAVRLLGAGTYAVLITDIYLEGMDGVDLMARARALDPDLELIVLTGGATVETAIAAMNHRAHAYLRKPVAPGEIEERVAAALARRRQQIERAATLRQLGAAILQIAEPQRPAYSAAPAPEAAHRVGSIEVDPQRRRASIAGQQMALSPLQFELLLYFARRADVVHSPERLAHEVLGHRCSQDEARELIKPHIHRLRKKIEATPGAPTRLISVRGAGYMLTAGD